jgi:cytochrome c553
MKTALSVVLIAIFCTSSAESAPPQVIECAACHGAAGLGNNQNGYPSLAGQSARYLYWQLLDFKRGLRKNRIMQSIAKPLSRAERTALAGYYSALPIPATSEPQELPSGLGAQLALHGERQPSPGIPACDFCHGTDGLGAGPFPRLAGQPAAYLAHQLQAWQEGSRPAGPLGLMGHVARTLTQSQIAAVSKYYSMLPAHTLPEGKHLSPP